MFKFQLSAAIAALAAIATATPSAELTASATNIVITEELSLALHIKLPPLKGDWASLPPYLNQRPIHIEAKFLEPDWKTGAIATANPKAKPPFIANPSGTGRDVPCYTLNKYQSDGFAAAMRDPFGMLDDDFFGNAFGPKAHLFPFLAEHPDDTADWALTVKTIPFRAIEPGTTIIPPITVTVPLITGVEKRRDRFGRMVNAVTGLKQTVLRTNPITIVVEGPPAAGRPKSWSGAIGTNLVCTASLDSSVCTAGDPLTLTLDIQGDGDLSRIHPPTLAEAATNTSFRIDDASARTETLGDRRRFTWRVRTVKAGTVEFPPLPFSWYDPVARRYVTATTESIPIQVKAGAQAALGAIAGEEEDADSFPMPDGIDLDPRGATPKPLLPHLAWSVTLFAGGPALFLLVYLLPGFRRRMAARREQARLSAAERRLAKALRGNDDDRLHKASIAYIELRYGVNGKAVTAADVKELMSGDRADSEIERISAALVKRDASRYAAGAVRAVIAMALCLVGAATTSAASTEFTWRRANALASTADTAEKFAAAAKAYRDCVDSGIANPIILQNLGAVSLLAGDARSSRAAFMLAELRTGETPSTRRGLQAALARLKNDPRAELPPTRLLLKPHVSLPLDLRLFIAAAAWALAWLVALMPPCFIRRALLTMAIAACVAASASVASSTIETRIAQGAANVSR